MRIVLLLTALLVACRSLPTPAPVTSGVSSRGIHYVVSGRGQPLVLIHGFQTDHREWDEVTAILEQQRQVIRYDLRGHGKSARADEPFFAWQDLAGLLTDLGVRTSDIVGLSTGSNAALELALVRPDLVRRLVLVSPGLPDIRVQASREWMRPIGEALRTRDAQKASQLWWASIMMEGTRARGVDGERYRAMVLENAPIWLQNPAAQQNLSPPMSERLSRLGVPVLLIVGERDVTGSLQQRDSILRRLPHAAHVAISRAGHMISTERPTELAAEIARFLTKR
ncbi:MAG TPA: alpha/beta hydrolase [Gemmatimonadaceae bacterium]|nr:alpha/beta hydrolase [Gemmatimonadaceae bacterium]